MSQDIQRESAIASISISEGALPPPPEAITAEAAFNHGGLLLDRDAFPMTKSLAADFPIKIP
jgi:hypothetical protein